MMQMEDDHLKILGVQENDAGQYTCRATNWAGTDEAQISLRVGAAPTVIQAPTGKLMMTKSVNQWEKYLSYSLVCVAV